MGFWIRAAAAACFAAPLAAEAQRPPAPPEPSPASVAPATGWRVRPDPGSLWRFYPERARVNEWVGYADLECVVGPAGELTACSVRDEAPDGAGFGAASQRVLATGRMQPSMAGQRITQSVVWNLPEDWPRRRLECWGAELGRLQRLGALSTEQRAQVLGRWTSAAADGLPGAAPSADAEVRLRQRADQVLAADPWPAVRDFENWRVCTRLYPTPALGLTVDAQAAQTRWRTAVDGMLERLAREEAERAAAPALALANEAAAAAASGAVTDVVWRRAPDPGGWSTYDPWDGAAPLEGELVAITCTVGEGGRPEACETHRQAQAPVPEDKFAARAEALKWFTELGLSMEAALAESRLEPLSRGGEPLAGRKVRLRFDKRPATAAQMLLSCRAYQVKGAAILYVGGRERILRQWGRDLHKKGIGANEAAAVAALRTAADRAEAAGQASASRKAWCETWAPAPPMGFW